MAKKGSTQKCARVASNVCASGVAAAAISLEKTCEAKQAALPRLLVELKKDVMKGRMSAAAADAVFKARMRGVEGTCRLQNARMKRAEEIAREAARKLEADRERIVGGQAMDGLFGLGLFGL
jgi:hypothetical protein